MSTPSNFLQFTASLDKYGEKLKAHLDKVVMHMAFAICENITVGGAHASGTPVDTGFARKSWVVSLGSPAAVSGDTANKSRADYAADAAAVMDALGAVLVNAKAGESVFLSNNVDYILALEYGHSLQAPYGMVEVTLSAAQQILDEVVAAMGIEGT